jgi:gliding motility-associated-like protein
MSLKLKRYFVVAGYFVFLTGHISAQNCIPTNINGTTINLSCNQVCTNLNFQIPHIKGTSDYVVTTIPYNPYPYTVPFSTEMPQVYVDDVYGPVQNMPFSFCFYGSVYNQFVAGSNGLLTFDIANASCGNSYNQTFPIPYASSNICSNSAPYYPQASVMGIFTDLYPVAIASPPDRKIAWHIEGVAPCRKLVLNYYNVGMFGNGNYSAGGTNCNSQNPTTFQIVLHESTGLIDVNIQRKACNATVGTGYNAILGVQDWTRTKAVAAPGKNATIWNESNTAYRFVPSGAGSRYSISELLDLSGNILATADTSTTTPGLLNLNFPNFCPPPGNNTYIVKTTFSACDNPANQLITYDTIQVNRNNSLNATASATNTNCGPPTGTITVTVPGGIGMPPYTFVLDGGTPQTGTSPFTFSNVAAGPHTVVVTDASGGCTSTININVGINNVLTASTATTGTTCAGVNNGSVTITPSGGTAPYNYVLNGGPPQPGGSPYTFNNLPPGSHTIVVSDAGGCISSPIIVNIASGPVFTTTVSKTDVLCNGGNNGTIVITQPATGNAPFEYSLDGTNWQTSNTFTGLAAGIYTAYFRESNGCQNSQQVTINEPTAISASLSSVPVVCNGQSNGTITVTASGGTAPFQYSLNGAPFQPGNIFNVSAGSYTVTIMDNNNCISTATINITEPAALTINLNAGNASCNGGNDGVITVTAGGGNSGYQYSLDGVHFQSSNVFNVLQGNYTVTVRDMLGCSATGNITVGLNSNLTFTPLADNTICEGTSAQLQFNSNATQYTWSPAAGLNNATISNPVASPVTTTQYIVTATLGLCSINDTVVVNVNPAPVPDAGPDGFICYGQSFRLQGSGGVSFTWSPSGYLDNATIANPVSTPITTTTYSLSVTDANGCQSLVTDVVTVDVTPPIHVQTYPKDTILYSGEQVQLWSGSIGNIYNWTPSIGLSNPTISNPVATAGAVGSEVIYKVTASTIAGCKGEGYAKIRVYKGPDVYMPSAFSPNSDGLNDFFKPTNVGIKQLNYFRIYNRWGQLLFSTNRLDQGWDGSFGGVKQPSGVYVWIIQAVTDDNRIVNKKGTMLLVR